MMWCVPWSGFIYAGPGCVAIIIKTKKLNLYLIPISYIFLSWRNCTNIPVINTIINAALFPPVWKGTFWCRTICWESCCQGNVKSFKPQLWLVSLRASWQNKTKWPINKAQTCCPGYLRWCWIWKGSRQNHVSPQQPSERFEFSTKVVGR